MSGCPFHLQKSLETIEVPAEPASDYAFLAEVYGTDSDEAGLRRAVIEAARERGEPAPLTERELTAAGRIAWRNHARCIGRLYWRTLVVRDRRNRVEPDAIAAELAAHLRAAQNGGNIRSILTVFAPAAGKGRKGPLIWNQQLCGYAGYRASYGSVLGDPRNAALTAKALELGWSAPARRSAFDLLPWILSGPDGRPHLFPLPEDLVQEVVIEHPVHPGFA